MAKFADSSSSESSDQELIPQTKKVTKLEAPVKKEAKTVLELQDMTWDMGVYKKVRLNNYKDKLYVDMREYYFDNNGKSLPTKKGMQISYGDLPLLQKILQEIKETVEKIPGAK